MIRNWPTNAPDPHQFAYLSFTPDTDEDKAAERFRAKFGHWPEWVCEVLGLLRVGPVPEKRNEA
jgi:hypothetical protein